MHIFPQIWGKFNIKVLNDLRCIDEVFMDVTTKRNQRKFDTVHAIPLTWIRRAASGKRAGVGKKRLDFSGVRGRIPLRAGLSYPVPRPPRFADRRGLFSCQSPAHGRIFNKSAAGVSSSGGGTPDRARAGFGGFRGFYGHFCLLLAAPLLTASVCCSFFAIFLKVAAAVVPMQGI